MTSDFGVQNESAGSHHALAEIQFPAVLSSRRFIELRDAMNIRVSYNEYNEYV